MFIGNLFCYRVQHRFRDFHVFTETTIQINPDKFQGITGRIMMNQAGGACAAPDYGIYSHTGSMFKDFYFRYCINNSPRKFMTGNKRKASPGMKFPLENMLITTTNSCIGNLVLILHSLLFPAHPPLFIQICHTVPTQLLSFFS